MEEWIGFTYEKDAFSGFPKVSGPGERLYTLRLRFTGDIREPGLQGKRLRASQDEVICKTIENSNTQGVQHLRDLRFIEENFGLPNTFDYAQPYYDIE